MPGYLGAYLYEKTLFRWFDISRQSIDEVLYSERPLQK